MNIAFLSQRRPDVLAACTLSALLTVSAAWAAGPLAIVDAPLFLNGTVAPLNMLVLGRDHKLYYEAYNDHSDLDGDGALDTTYKPDRITYYGYFDSNKCYSYNSSGTRFDPVAVATSKRCSGQWSGDWLNYVTTSRIDALRKVLYGGMRSTDTVTQTVLERSYIPQDAHSWGKSYESLAKDGYDIRLYTPLALPAANSSHLFANTTLRSDASNYPRLRVLRNRQDAAGQPLKIWNWLSIERPVADVMVVTGTTGGAEIRTTVTPDTPEMVVRTKVCDSAVPGGVESNCKAYTSSSGTTVYKPTGLLQDFGEQDLMKFGLITGSYARNTDGGVLRQKMGSVKNEINADGTFNTGVTGIIATLNRLKTTGFDTDYTYDCGWKVTGAITAGECQMWGNPIAEMMYEGLRYFAGKGTPTSGYTIAFGAGEESQLTGSGLPVASWNDPYSGSGAAPWCAKPFETVISDINPSYDSDKLPGSSFATFSGDLTGLDVTNLGQKMWDQEFGTSKKMYIGRSLSDGNDDKAPTPKSVTSFGNIRGLAPEEPTKEGSYYSGSVAYYGATHDVNSVTGEQKVQTFAVALASSLPRIEIPVGSKTITLVPFAKTVGGSVSGQNVSAATNGFQPTNQIVDFYVDTLSAGYGKFRVNYEDVEQGADHDMDAIVQYEYTVKADNTVDVKLTSQYAAGSLIQHVGYVISGTTHDGIYFEVRDTDTASGSDPDYYLDTPDGYIPGSGSGSNQDGVALPLVHTRNFAPGATASAGILRDPLWYAAKWGGFKDQDNNDIPNLPAEWDEDNNGTPSNYFLVTNALTLPAQLTKAFADILRRVSSAASASVNSGSISNDTRVFQAKFKSGDWNGELLSFPVNTDGTLGPAEWKAQDRIPAPGSRAIITYNSNSATAVPFRWGTSGTGAIGANRQSQLDPDGVGATVAQSRLDYLRGNQTNEATGLFRKRPNLLGDIVSSSPIFVGKPPFLYQDATYASFVSTYANRMQMVYVGANDGMLHGFDVATGVERLAFIPSPVFRNLAELTKPSYPHKFYVDGTPSMADVYYGSAWHTVLAGGLNKGGQGIYLLDVTNPANFSETNAANIYKWEYTDANDADLGYTYSRPAIAKVRTGSGTTKWAAVFGNGYNNTFDDTAAGGQKSSTGNAALYVVDVETGALLRKISVPAGTAQDPTGSSRPNGLNTPALVDVNNDTVADYVFAGDLFGNLWKFDITGNSPAIWSIAFGGSPLYVAKDGSGKQQPITSRPEVGRGPNSKGLIVLFGTGKFLEANDKDLTKLSTQTFYGLIDPNDGATGAISGRSQLTAQQIIFEDNVTFGTRTVPVRATTQNSVVNRGWYLDLLSGPPGVPPPTGFKGEMAVSDPILRNGRIIFSTIIPSIDPCAFGGTSWLMELDALSGGRLTYPPLDLNDDKKFDNNDYVTLADGTKVPVSGEGSQEGMIGKAGVLSSKDAEFKYTSGTTGNMQIFRENPGPGDIGRQSWRQLR